MKHTTIVLTTEPGAIDIAEEIESELPKLVSSLSHAIRSADILIAAKESETYRTAKLNKAIISFNNKILRLCTDISAKAELLLTMHRNPGPYRMFPEQEQQIKTLIQEVDLRFATILREKS